jgi:hypothetical protein
MSTYPCAKTSDKSAPYHEKTTLGRLRQVICTVLLVGIQIAGFLVHSRSRRECDTDLGPENFLFVLYFCVVLLSHVDINTTSCQNYLTTS